MKYLILFIFSFLISLIITPLVRRLSLDIGATDKLEIRKAHTKRVVARLGGIAIFVAFYSSALGLFFIDRETFFIALSVLKGIFPASLLILFLGIYDDLKGADAKTKLFFQMVAALIVIQYGVKIDIITNPFKAGNSFNLHLWSIPVTIFWIIFITNAMNLLDGLDGLASGVSCIISLTMFFIALYHKKYLVMALSISLAGATMGFLRYNFNPAKIFMGDAGSLFLGFILACISIRGSQKSATTVALLIPVIAMGLPIIDTLLAIVRRFLNGKNIFRADNEHIHHKLMRLGLSHKRSVFTLYIVSICLGLIAFLFTLIKDEFVGGILFIVAVLVFVILNNFRLLISNRSKLDLIDNKSKRKI